MSSDYNFLSPCDEYLGSSSPRARGIGMSWLRPSHGRVSGSVPEISASCFRTRSGVTTSASPNLTCHFSPSILLAFKRHCAWWAWWEGPAPRRQPQVQRLLQADITEDQSMTQERGVGIHPLPGAPHHPRQPVDQGCFPVGKKAPRLSAQVCLPTLCDRPGNIGIGRAWFIIAALLAPGWSHIILSPLRTSCD